MRTGYLIALTVLAAGSRLALAAGDTQDHQAHHTGGDADAAASQAMAGGGMPMHQHMQKMRQQMAEIHRTSDPDRRDELIAAHMDSMREMMKMMHGGKSMMGGPGVGMMPPGSDMPGGPMMGDRRPGMAGGPGGMVPPGSDMPGGKMMGEQRPGMAGGPGGMMQPGSDMPGGKMMGDRRPGMAGGPGGMMGGPGAGMMDMMNRQRMMERRMDMMEMMMDQMIGNRAAAAETRRMREGRHDHRKMK